MWLTVMGPVRAWQDDTELELGPAKRQALLALLLVRSGQPTSLSTIIDVLWGQTPPSSAANVVYRHAAAVRRLLETPGADPGEDGTPATRLVRVSGGYRLDASPSTLDLLRFRQLRGAAEDMGGTGALRDSVRLLTRALRLSRGPTASGIPPHIAQHPYFMAVDREYLTAVKEAAVIATAVGEPGSVLDILQPAAAQHPLDEILQAQLVRTLAATGRQAEALQAYHAVRTRLAEQLGIAPGPELRSVHQDIMRRDAHEAPRLSPAFPAEPARARPQEPRRSLLRPSQLPPDVTDFAGREAELARLDTLFPVDAPAPDDAGHVGSEPRSTHDTGNENTPPRPPVAIVGMPGVGKTTLAVHWAHRIAPRFPDGQLYVDLRGLAIDGTRVTPSEAQRAFLVALGVPDREIPADRDTRTDLYRSTLAGLRLLIVVDDVAHSDQVRPLLPGTPGALVLVTSRDRLGGLAAREGARPLVLADLSPAEAREALVRRLGGRGTGTGSGAVSGTDSGAGDAVDDTAAACARLPLASAVAGADVLRPDGRLPCVASEFRAREVTLDEFTESGPQADIRSVFAWSYRQLAPDSARMFRLLALHPGFGIAATTAASLAGIPLELTRELLAELTRAHLLTEEAPDLYVLHDLLAAYARELLRGSDREGQRGLSIRRMLDHYVHTARAAATQLAPQRTEQWPLPRLQPRTTPEPLPDRERAADWLDRLLLPVLIPVAGEAAARGLHAHVCQLGLALEVHLDRRARWEEQLALQKICLLSAEAQGDLWAAAHAHRALGFAQGRLGRPVEARTHLFRALSLFTEADDPRGQGATHRALAFRANAAVRHDRALDHYGQALALYRSAGDTLGESSALNGIGRTLVLKGDHHAALDHCARAVELSRAAGDLNGQAAAQDGLGHAHHHLGEYDRALSQYRRALALYRELSDRCLEADVLVHVGQTQHAQSYVDLAAESWERALSVLDALHHPEAGALRRRLAELRAGVPREASG
ncbi:tetratricopeptide repeat protein [Streptomyces sp. NBC_00252]|uniref:AfsR/SARP family transcriptional regulator n=1 Tax=Streptomyces sp. NBC_00252 TaxID=2975691 RepID=UPI002E2B757B|nr:BTAD domain-containing putative transcriptional regulator [Streptomyces sp. NBC_00252]